MGDEKRTGWSETKTYPGRWWPAGAPETGFLGYLEFEDRRPRLTLVSLLPGQQVFDLDGPDVLHGELDFGEQVTLWDTGGHRLHFLREEGDSMTTSREFTHAIMGQHLGNYDEERFSYSAYRLHGVGVWGAVDTPIPRGLPSEVLPQYEPVLLSGFERDDSGIEYTAKVHIENPRRLEADARFPDGAIVNHPGENARVVFEVTPPAPARFHDVLLFDLQALLTFSYQGGAPLQAEWLATGHLDKALSVMRWDSFIGHKPVGHVFRQNMILHTGLVDPVVLFPAWWKAVEEFYPATQVISLYHHGPRGILEGSTASVIAVAEHLHGIMGPTRTRFHDGFLDSKKKLVKQAFPSREDAPFRQFLYEALQNNHPTLDTRLTELVAAVTPERLTLMTIDPRQWMSDVKAVRNLLAHTSSHVRRRGGDSSLLDRVNSQTRAIVTVLIMQQMGLGAAILDHASQVLATWLRRLTAQRPPCK